MTFQSQGLFTQDDHAYSAPDMQSCTQSSPHKPSLHHTSSQTCGHDQKSRPQQVYKELPEPQWVPSPQIQHRMPRSMQAIVGPQHCASVATTFFLKHKQFNPTNDPVTTHVIVDDQGSLAYTVDRKRTSLKTSRVLRDAAGHPICTMRLQVMIHAYLTLCPCCVNDNITVKHTHTCIHSYIPRTRYSHRNILFSAHIGECN